MALSAKRVAISEQINKIATTTRPDVTKSSWEVVCAWEIREYLEGHMKTADIPGWSTTSAGGTFFTGSYRRQTAVEPIEDIDMFAPISVKASAAADAGKARPSASTALAAVNGILASRKLETWLTRTAVLKGCSVTTRVQTRSVGITVTTSKRETMSYDVVPAISHIGELYWIPDGSLDGWILSNPKAAIDKCVAEDAKHNSHLREVIRLVKRWNRNQPEGDQLKSFHLEVMCYNILVQNPQTTEPSQLLIAAFLHLKSAVNQPCPTPGVPNQRIDDYLQIPGNTLLRAKAAAVFAVCATHLQKPDLTSIAYINSNFKDT